MLLWWRDFLFFLFPLVEKKKDNKDGGRWGKKRDLINELQHPRAGSLAAPGSCSGLRECDANCFFPSCICVPLRPHCPCGRGGISAQALSLIFH